MKFATAVYWDAGKKETNQDSLLIEQICTTKGRVLLAAVCDGIGGLKEGEIASGFLAEKLQAHFYGELLTLIRKGRHRKTIKRSLFRCLSEAARMLKEYGIHKDLSLGTTVSALLIWGHQYLIIHAGDSRIYRLYTKSGKVLTTDHRKGGNVLTRCIGSFPYQLPEGEQGRCYGTSHFLLCTDGFWGKGEELIYRLFGTKEKLSEEQAGKRLSEIAAHNLKCGETDNQTAIYVSVGI